MKKIFFLLLLLSTATYASHDLFPKDPFRHLESVPPGKSYWMTCKVQNIGEVCSSRFEVGFYFSKDSVFDNFDILLKNKNIQTIGANAWIGINDAFVIPANATPGDYYILYVVDKDNNVAEANENNNVTCLPLTVESRTVELVLGNYNVQQTGSDLYVDYTLRNDGNLDSPGFRTSVYISKDNVVDSSDIRLSSFDHTIGWGSAYAYGKSFSLPSNLKKGKYYIITIFDDLQKVSEYDETNNSGNAMILLDLTGKGGSVQSSNSSGAANEARYSEDGAVNP